MFRPLLGRISSRLYPGRKMVQTKMNRKEAELNSRTRPHSTHNDATTLPVQSAMQTILNKTDSKSGLLAPMNKLNNQTCGYKINRD